MTYSIIEILGYLRYLRCIRLRDGNGPPAPLKPKNPRILHDMVGMLRPLSPEDIFNHMVYAFFCRDPETLSERDCMKWVLYVCDPTADIDNLDQERTRLINEIGNMWKKAMVWYRKSGRRKPVSNPPAIGLPGYKDGFQPLTGPMFSWYRPIAIQLIIFIAHKITVSCLLLAGFERRSCVINPKWKITYYISYPLSGAEDRTIDPVSPPIIFLQGLGLGMLMYAPYVFMMRHIVTRRHRTLCVPEWEWIGLHPGGFSDFHLIPTMKEISNEIDSLVQTVIKPRQVSLANEQRKKRGLFPLYDEINEELLTEAEKEEKRLKIFVVGHSYGTTIASSLLHNFGRRLVVRAALMEPLSFYSQLSKALILCQLGFSEVHHLDSCDVSTRPTFSHIQSLQDRFRLYLSFKMKRWSTLMTLILYKFAVFSDFGTAWTINRHFDTEQYIDFKIHSKRKSFFDKCPLFVVFSESDLLIASHAALKQVAHHLKRKKGEALLIAGQGHGGHVTPVALQRLSQFLREDHTVYTLDGKKRMLTKEQRRNSHLVQKKNKKETSFWNSKGSHLQTMHTMSCPAILTDNQVAFDQLTIRLSPIETSLQKESNDILSTELWTTNKCNSTTDKYDNNLQMILMQQSKSDLKAVNDATAITFDMKLRKKLQNSTDEDIVESEEDDPLPPVVSASTVFPLKFNTLCDKIPRVSSSTMVTATPQSDVCSSLSDPSLFHIAHADSVASCLTSVAAAGYHRKDDIINMSDSGCKPEVDDDLYRLENLVCTRKLPISATDPGWIPGGILLNIDMNDSDITDSLDSISSTPSSPSTSSVASHFDGDSIPSMQFAPCWRRKPAPLKNKRKRLLSPIIHYHTDSSIFSPSSEANKIVYLPQSQKQQHIVPLQSFISQQELGSVRARNSASPNRGFYTGENSN